MGYLLNVVYLVLVAVLSPWLIFSAARKGKYRQGFAAKWLGRAPLRTSSRRCAWLHAVSVGEVNLLEPLLRALKARHPSWEFVISTTSATGYALAKQKYADHAVFYCPLDFTWSVKAALRRIRPDLLILAELELWPNLIWSARRQGVAMAVFNARLSEKSFRGYLRIRPLLASILRSIDVIIAQNSTYAERFRELGALRVEVAGNLKFDGAESDRANPRTTNLASLAGIRSEDVVLVAGSTQAPEEEVVLKAFLTLRQQCPQLRLVLVPRHPERFAEVAALLDNSDIVWERRSRLEHHSANPVARVLLVDVVGELGAWWGTARVGFVGGSLLNRRGGQNMIEPAAYGVAVACGPNTWNFREIVRQLTERQAIVVVESAAELTDFVARCLQEPAFAQHLGDQARRLAAEQRGATARTVDALDPLFGEVSDVLPFVRQAA